eukprot:scaffold32931_cov62-Phaeocystis_antarctica.AAC.9
MRVDAVPLLDAEDDRMSWHPPAPPRDLLLGSETRLVRKHRYCARTHLHGCSSCGGALILGPAVAPLGTPYLLAGAAVRGVRVRVRSPSSLPPQTPPPSPLLPPVWLPFWLPPRLATSSGAGACDSSGGGARRPLALR